MINHTPDNAPPAPPCLPESWPPADPIEPVRARRIPWWLAPFVAPAAIFFPRRMGPHLAESSFAAAYAVHWFWAIVAVGGAFAFQFKNWDLDRQYIHWGVSLNPLLEIRRAVAGAVQLLYGSMTDPVAPFVIGVATCFIEIAVWPAGLLLLVFHTVGEQPRRAYLRSVKLLLWSTIVFVPGLWLLSRCLILARHWRLDDPRVALFGLFVFVAWWLLTLLRMGQRYGGPAVGPRWEPRQPRCETCGYSLVTLPILAKCPECATQVDESLPDQRQPTAFAAARGLRARFRGFWRTTGEAQNLSRFVRHVPVWREHRAARPLRLRLCMAFVIGLIAFGGSLLIAIGSGSLNLSWRSDPLDFLIALASANTDVIQTLDVKPIKVLFGLAAIGVFAGLATIAWVMIAGAVIARCGFRNLSDRIVVVCYAAAWLPIPTLLGLAGAAVGVTFYPLYVHVGPVPIGRLGSFDALVLIGLLSGVPMCVATYVSFRRVCRALREVHWANA